MSQVMDSTVIREACEDAGRLKLIAVELGLDGVGMLSHYTSSELGGIYNGAGPDRWPEPPREFLTHCLYLFAPSFLIHDVGFHLSDGSRAGWRRENARCLGNCLRTIRKVYPLWSWRFVRNFLARRRWRPLALLVGVSLMTEPCLRAWREASER